MQAFLKRKNIVISTQRYGIEALSAMALGLFSSLIVGLILKTTGQQTATWFGENLLSTNLITLGTFAMQYMGAAIGVAVAYRLQAPPLVLFSSVVTGAMGATSGGPAGAFIAALLACEFGKAISKETKLDIIVTPFVTLLIGYLASLFISPLIGQLMTFLGQIIMTATTYHPFLMGIIVAVVMGLVLTAPISSAALAIMLGLSGIAAGAATVGCAAQMIGFAVMSYRENKVSGLISQGLGTSMLQIPNIIKNWWIILPPTLASAVLGPLSTMVFKMTNIPAGAGMGTSGLVGPLTTFQDMGFSTNVLISVVLLHFILPAILTLLFAAILRKQGKIKDGDLKLDLN
ncbi:MAG: PTS sugar transporter subunit IIC [Erysipelotrichales bacterium]|nr:MAG: PTS sugar transporter subunit IIC [Erysipelotrichales bacterium]